MSFIEHCCGEIFVSKQFSMANLGQISAIYKGTTAPTNKNLLWALTNNDDPLTQVVIEWYKWYSGAWTSFRDLYHAIHVGENPPTDISKIWKVVDGADAFLKFMVYDEDQATWIDLYADLLNEAEQNTITTLINGADSGYQNFAEVQERIEELRMDQVATPTGKTLALTDAYKVLDCSNTGSISLQIPLNSTVEFPIGTIIVIERNGAGSVTIFTPAGVVLNGVDSDSYQITDQYDACSIRKRGTNEWVIKGNIN